MDWKEVGKKIGEIGLTTLGAAFGGSAGGTVGAILGKAIFGDKEQEITPEKIADALGNPEQVMKMREFELAHQLELEKLVLEAERIRLADVQSARSADVEKTKASGKRDVNLYFLAWLVVIGFFTLIGVLIFAPSAMNKEQMATLLPTVTMLFGALSTGFGQVLQYFFGSSKSSAEKTNLLAKANPIE
jgi:hypothetical protein